MFARIAQILVLIVSVAVFIAPVHAQDVSASHVAAAKKAMQATGATERLDKILPDVAQATKTALISNRPDLVDQVSLIVDETAIELAPRRADIENEVALIYTRVYSEEELNTIADFFSSEVGQKLLNQTPVIFNEVDRASRIWGTGLSRDLSEKVREKMNEQGLQ